MGNNYNSIAKVYDALSHVVFQSAIMKAQEFLVQFINPDDNVLIAGGGTGKILEAISSLNKRNISIVYVEKSSSMIALSRKRNCKNLNVEFVNVAVEDHTPGEKFDVIITPFFFDNFKEDKVQLVFAKLDAALKQNGLWLYADFVNDKAKNKFWQRLLLKTMYLFFRLTVNIETQKLVEMQPYFLKKCEPLASKFYYHDFIQAKVYKKKAV